MAELVETTMQVLEGVDWSQPPTVSLAVGEEIVVPYEWGSKGVTFRDLPPGQPLEARLVGPGYVPLAQQLEAQPPGEAVRAVIEAEYKGLGSLVLEPWQGSYVVTVVDSFRRRESLQPGTHQVNAGRVVVTVSGKTGSGSRTVVVGNGQTMSLDVTGLVPGQVTLTQVPAGSTISYGLTDRGLDRVLEVGWPEAPLDPDVGIPVLAAFPLQDLETGSYSYELRQPWLGVMRGEFFAVGGEVGAHKVVWKDAPGVESLSTAYQAYLAQAQASKGLGPHGGRAAIGVGLSTVAVAGTAVALLRGITAQGDVATLTELYDAALAEGRTEDANSHYLNRSDARKAATLGWAGSGIGAALSGVSLVFTVSQFGKAKADKGEAPVWDPQALPPVLPVGNPTAAPAEANDGQAVQPTTE